MDFNGMSLTPSKQPSEDVYPIENRIIPLLSRQIFGSPLYLNSPFKFGWILSVTH